MTVGQFIDEMRAECENTGAEIKAIHFNNDYIVVGVEILAQNRMWRFKAHMANVLVAKTSYGCMIMARELAMMRSSNG